MSFGTLSPHGRGGGKGESISLGLSKELVLPLFLSSSSYVYVSTVDGSAALVSDKGRVFNMTQTCYSVF